MVDQCLQRKGRCSLFYVCIKMSVPVCVAGTMCAGVHVKNRGQPHFLLYPWRQGVYLASKAPFVLSQPSQFWGDRFVQDVWRDIWMLGSGPWSSCLHHRGSDSLHHLSSPWETNSVWGKNKKEYAFRDTDPLQKFNVHWLYSHQGPFLCGYVLEQYQQNQKLFGNQNRRRFGWYPYVQYHGNQPRPQLNPNPNRWRVIHMFSQATVGTTSLPIVLNLQSSCLLIRCPECPPV